MPPRVTTPGASQPAIGQVGRFVLRSELGAGASGTVFLADDPVLERQVALKVPRLADNDPVRRQRFLREAKVAGKLRHPAIVATFEGGQSADNLYIASEFVSGKTLDRIIVAGQPACRQSAEWVRRLAEGLDYAHSESIIHRDVKPGNIIIDDQQQPRLLDFGLARNIGENTGLTTEGHLLGTPFYMSPEQARGDVHAVGPRSDQYSLGVVLYELLTGHVPFDGAPHVVLPQVINDPPPRPRSIDRRIPRDLEVICLKCLAKAPRDRYVSCRELADDLARWLAGDPIAARKTPVWELAARWANRNRLAGGLAGAALLLVVVITAISFGAAAYLSRVNSRINAALDEARQLHAEQENHRQQATEQRAILEQQKERSEAQRKLVVETSKEIENTLAARLADEKELDELIKSRQAELDKSARSQAKAGVEQDKGSLAKAETVRTVEQLRDELKQASPATVYSQTLQLSLPAIKAGIADAADLLDECRPEDR